jgi:hypothetical protein
MTATPASAQDLRDRDPGTGAGSCARSDPGECTATVAKGKTGCGTRFEDEAGTDDTAVGNAEVDGTGSGAAGFTGERAFGAGTTDGAEAAGGATCVAGVGGGAADGAGSR